MIEYKRYTLKNGLTVVLHQDKSTPLVVVNVLYKVGSRNETPDKTGFAHLFEHLMFSGSENIDDFDMVIQNAGGENNAFTNKDITNFYDILPAENLETALWLESDRMEKLNINQKSLDIQKKVVIEEFKETSLNKPYGDLWHHISALAFEKHSYRWPTIGLVPEHIENAKLEDVSNFFNGYYAPGNAVLVLSGNFEFEIAEKAIENWFGSIQNTKVNPYENIEEPAQTIKKSKTLQGKVPADALYMVFHMPDRLHKDFFAYDLLSDVLSGGRSSRFYQNLLKGTDIFSNVSAYITGSIDPGLFVVEAKLMGDNKVELAKAKIWQELNQLKEALIDAQELEKVKNSLISSVCYSEVSVLHKAINLAYYEMLGDINMINTQEEDYSRVTAEDLLRISQYTFNDSNCSEIVYLKENGVNEILSE